MTSVAGGCMPNCHGFGSAAGAIVATATPPITPSMSATTAFAVVFVVNNLVNRTMRLQPLIRYGLLADPPAGFGRAAKPSGTYTKARSDNNRVNPVSTPCDEPPQRRNIPYRERSRLSLASA